MCNNTSDRKHADTILERYVTETVMGIVTTFFSSPFSDQSTSLQVTCYNNAKGLKKKKAFTVAINMLMSISALVYFNILKITVTCRVHVNLSA